ncbi:hypothetical protein SALBM311S_03646 [Streptomyces alboniger]
MIRLSRCRSAWSRLYGLRVMTGTRSASRTRASSGIPSAANNPPNASQLGRLTCWSAKYAKVRRKPWLSMSLLGQTDGSGGRAPRRTWAIWASRSASAPMSRVSTGLPFPQTVERGTPST